MQYDTPEVTFVQPLGNYGLQPVPDSLDIHKIIDKGYVHLYNPLNRGLSIRRVNVLSLTFKDLSREFILDSEYKIDNVKSSPKIRFLFNQLAILSNSSFNLMAQTLGKQVFFTPRIARKMEFTPDDIQLVPQTPTRKISTPKNTAKPNKPKPGGF